MKIEYLENGLTECVYEHLRDCTSNTNELQHLIEDVLDYGLSSGVIPSLIYTEDVIQFAKSHLMEIFETLEEMKDEGIINEVPCDITEIVYSVFAYITEKLYLSIKWPSSLKKE